MDMNNNNISARNFISNKLLVFLSLKYNNNVIGAERLNPCVIVKY